MARRIIWTEPAVNELEAVIHYWNNRNKSTSYIKKIRTVLRRNLKLIALQPEIGRRTNLPRVKAKLMLEHFFIIYILGNNDELVILNIWDCRQNPELEQLL